MIPSLFIAHGSPMLALEDNEYTQFLHELGKTISRPKAIVLFSAHWENNVQMVSEVENYPMIYDFGGFPEALYRIQYPAQGDTKIALEIEGLLGQYGVDHKAETQRGLDHGAWVVLRMLYPNADIPVVEMSVNPNLTPDEQYRIGKALSALRENDVLIVGSGGTVHNLRAVKMHQQRGQADAWAVEFDDWLAAHMVKWDLESLCNYASLAPHAQLAVPPYGREHFVTLMYAMGAADDTRVAKLLHRSFQYGNLSHSVWQFG